MLGSLRLFNTLVGRVKREPEGFCSVLDISVTSRWRRYQTTTMGRLHVNRERPMPPRSTATISASSAIQTTMPLPTTSSGRSVIRTQSSVSDADVPGVTCLGSRRADALTKLFETVCDRQARDEFYVLVAQLAREPHAKRPTVGHRKLIAIHSVTEKRLRMQSIGHIYAVPRIGFHRVVHNISGLRVNPHEMQDMGERHADPLGYIGPALFTHEFGNVTARRIALELAYRKRRRLSDHAIDGEPPLRETSGLKTPKVFREGRELVRKWTRRNLAAREFACQ